MGLFRQRCESPTIVGLTQSNKTGPISDAHVDFFNSRHYKSTSNIPNRERDADMETMATVTAFPPSKLLSSSCSFFSRALSHPSFPCRSASVQPRIRSRSTLRISAVSPRRRTLSEEWDLSNSVAAPGAFQIPSFEELDTTNMLLRQRIVFLGSQVFSHTDIYVSERIVVIFLSFSNNFHSLVCYLS